VCSESEVARGTESTGGRCCGFVCSESEVARGTESTGGRCCGFVCSETEVAWVRYYFAREKRFLLVFFLAREKRFLLVFFLAREKRFLLVFFSQEKKGRTKRRDEIKSFLAGGRGSSEVARGTESMGASTLSRELFGVRVIMYACSYCHFFSYWGAIRGGLFLGVF